MVWLQFRQLRTPEKTTTPVATDYEIRSDVKESQDNSPGTLQFANAQDARSGVRELDAADAMDGHKGIRASSPSSENLQSHFRRLKET